MCRGPLLLITEVNRAAELRKMRFSRKRITWRKIGELLGRDHAGLCRAVNRLESERARAAE